MEIIGVQHILSLSGAAEKVQQTTQQRPDIASHNIVASEQDEEAERSRANPPAELTQEARLQPENNKRRGGGKMPGAAKKREGEKDDTVLEEVEYPSDYGNVVDLRV